MARPWLVVDSETHPITDRVKAPRLVCASTCSRSTGVALYSREEAIAFYRWALPECAARRLVLVFMNAPFDLGVAAQADPALLDYIFEAYRVDAFRDVKERQKLIDLANGQMKYLRDPETGEFAKQAYTLEAMVRRTLGREMVKSGGKCDGSLRKVMCGCGSWQMHFSELDGLPVEEYPEDARRYMVTDPVDTHDLYEHQQSLVGQSIVVNFNQDGEVVVTDEANQLRAGWALHLATLWGLETDLNRVAVLKARLEEEQARVRDALVPHGIYEAYQWKKGANAGKWKYTRKLKEVRRRVAAGFAKRGLRPPATEGWDKAEKRGEAFDVEKYVQTSQEACRDSLDRELAVLADGMEGMKILSTDVPHLELGSVHPSYNTILETGRCSSFDPNIQQLPRELETAAEDTVRACYRARDGFLYCSCDYSQVEVVALAEVCLELFGWSRLADAVNAGMDVHSMMASEKLKMDYAELVRRRKADKHSVEARTRQLAKGPVFGIPGGMGDAKLVDYVRSQPGHFLITLEEAKEWRAIYLQLFPEVAQLFKWVDAQVGPARETVMVQAISGRVRGGVGYTKYCNGLFQQRVADGAKEAHFEVARECYAVPSSPLYGSRVAAFIHDELLLEVPEARAHEAAERCREVMEGVMRAKYIKRVKVEATPALMKYWMKVADTVRDPETGRLVEWVPQERRAA